MMKMKKQFLRPPPLPAVKKMGIVSKKMGIAEKKMEVSTIKDGFPCFAKKMEIDIKKDGCITFSKKKDG